MNALEDLVSSLSRLPGLGKKSARRIAYHLLKCDQNLSDGIARQISDLKARIHSCQVCGNYTERPICEVCTQLGRDKQTICVVEQAQDIGVIENSHEYNGLYHVLQGVLAPLDGIGPEKLNIATLVQRVRANQIEELIIATNPTLEGDTTALYLKKLFEADQVKVTRLALGLPVGGDLEYADRLTLARSLRARTSM